MFTAACSQQQRWDTTHMCISRLTAKKHVIYIYNDCYSASKREGYPVTCYSGVNLEDIMVGEISQLYIDYFRIDST